MSSCTACCHLGKTSLLSDHTMQFLDLYELSAGSCITQLRSSPVKRTSPCFTSVSYTPVLPTFSNLFVTITPWTLSILHCSLPLAINLLKSRSINASLTPKDRHIRSIVRERYDSRIWAYALIRISRT